MKSKKNKSDEPSLIDELTGNLSKAFMDNFRENGVATVELLRQKHPEKFIENVVRFIAAAQTHTQPKDGYANCQSTQEVARKLLVDCGASEFAITDDMIEEAIKESDRHVEELGRIASRAVQ